MKVSDLTEKIAAIVHRVAPLMPQEQAVPAQRLQVAGTDTEMDSVAVLQLVVALEEEFGIVVEDADISPVNFGDLGALTRFVSKKLQTR